MPRQIVPVSDVAAILLTQDEGDLRYLPISYTPPPTDLSNYWTKAQADGRYEPIDTMYTKGESDARYYTQAQSDARFQPVGSYSLTSHNHDAAYVNATGDTMTGALILTPTNPNYALDVTGNVMIKTGYGIHFANPAQTLSHGWATDASNLFKHLVNGAATGTYLATGGDLYVKGAVNIVPGAENLSGEWLYNNGGARSGFCGLEGDYTTWRVYGNIGTPGNRLSINLSTGYVLIPGGLGVSGDITTTGAYVGNGSVLTLNATGNIQLNPAGTYIHPPSNNTINLGHPGLNWVYVWTYNVNSPGGAQLGINGGFHLILTASNGGWIYHRSTGHTFFDGSQGAVVAPEIDNKLILGGTGNRWVYVAAVQGSINTSAAIYKKNFTPLDPVACTQAVLETDWLSFDYLPPPPPEPEEGETPQERIATLGEYTKAQEKDAFIRRQNGYVLGHPTHKTHNLFGLADREHASPSADLGILACALQAALKRIAALEGVTP